MFRPHNSYRLGNCLLALNSFQIRFLLLKQYRLKILSGYILIIYAKFHGFSNFFWDRFLIQIHNQNLKALLVTPPAKPASCTEAQLPYRWALESCGTEYYDMLTPRQTPLVITEGMFFILDAPTPYFYSFISVKGVKAIRSSLISGEELPY